VSPVQEENILEQSQQRALKMIKGLQLRLRDLGLLSLEKEKIHWDLINAHKYQMKRKNKKESGSYQ